MRARVRGLGLLEVLVTATIFSLVLVFLVSLARNSKQLASKSESVSDATTEAALLIAHLRAEFRGAILLPGPESFVKYRHPRLDPVTGLVSTGPAGDVETTGSLIEVVNNQVRCSHESEGGRYQVLGRLGKRGTIRFLRPSSDTLGVQISIVVDDLGNAERRARWDGTVKYYFPNQPD